MVPKARYGVVVLTAAHPSPADPLRAPFIAGLHEAMLEEARGRLDLRVIAPRVHAGDPSEETSGGVPVRRFSYPSRGRRLKEERRVPPLRLFAYLVSAYRAVRRETEHARPRLLLGHWVLPSGLVLRAAAVRAGVPYLLYAHGSDLDVYARPGSPGALLARWALKRAEFVFAASPALADRCSSALGVRPDRVLHLPMGVSPRFSPGDRNEARARLGLGRKPVFLFAGDLTADKGAGRLAEAAGELALRGVRAEIAFAGTGPLTARIEALSRKLAESPVEIRLLGGIPQETLLDWYRASDALVLPSRHEGTPLVVGEALRCGLPVVATRVGGIPSAVAHGRSGILLETGDVEELARALEELAADEALRAVLRQGVLEGPQPLGMREQARIVLSIFEQAMARDTVDS